MFTGVVREISDRKRAVQERGPLLGLEQVARLHATPCPKPEAKLREDCDDHRDTFFAQEIDTEANTRVGPRLAIEHVSSGPVFVGDDSAWFGGYGHQGDTVAFGLDPGTHAVEEFIRIGDFVYSGMAFDAGNAALWVARSAPASVVAWSSTPPPISGPLDWERARARLARRWCARRVDRAEARRPACWRRVGPVRSIKASAQRRRGRRVR